MIAITAKAGAIAVSLAAFERMDKSTEEAAVSPKHKAVNGFIVTVPGNMLNIHGTSKAQPIPTKEDKNKHNTAMILSFISCREPRIRPVQ